MFVLKYLKDICEVTQLAASPKVKTGFEPISKALPSASVFPLHYLTMCINNLMYESCLCNRQVGIQCSMLKVT